MSARVVTSIINYRTGDLTIAAAQSVLETMGDRAGAVVIVDNASGDGSADQIADWIGTRADSRLHLIRSATNSGFSGGHNQTFSAFPDADFYLVLNSDAWLRPGFFDAILQVAEAHPQAGLIGPRLEHEDGTRQDSCFRCPGALSEVIRGARTGPVTALLRRHVVSLPMPPDPDAVDWMSFACILVRGAMLREIGPMDEGYFLYFEDTEYGLRAKRAGWALHYTEAARAVHLHGKSGGLESDRERRARLPRFYWCARTRLLRQANGPLGPLLGNLGWIAGRAVARLRLFTGRGIPRAHDGEWRDVWAGVTDPLRRCPRPWEDRGAGS